MLQMPNNGNTKTYLGRGRRGDWSRAVIKYELRQVSKGDKHSYSEEKKRRARMGHQLKVIHKKLWTLSLSISGKRYARRKQGEGEGRGRDEPKGKP